MKSNDLKNRALAQLLNYKNTHSVLDLIMQDLTKNNYKDKRRSSLMFEIEFFQTFTKECHKLYYEPPKEIESFDLKGFNKVWSKCITLPALIHHNYVMMKIDQGYFLPEDF